MKTIYAILFLAILTACEMPGKTGSSSSDSQTAPPRVILLGDTNVASAAGFAADLAIGLGYETKNYSRTWDGSNGAMLMGHQTLGQFYNDFRAGDKVVLMAGLYDSKYYGAADLMDQVKTYHKAFMKALVARGCKVYVATVPRLPAAGYATAAPLNHGSDAASDFYSNMIRSVAQEINSPLITVIDLNQYFPNHIDYFESNGYIFNKNGHNLLAQMFLNDMRR